MKYSWRARKKTNNCFLARRDFLKFSNGAQKRSKTQGKPMIFKNRDGQCYFFLSAFFFFRFLRDHANEDHVWTKNIGKPTENQWFLKIAHERKWSSPKKAVFSEVPGAQKCCKKQYEIKIFVVRDQKTTWEIMKMKIMYEQKTWENLKKTYDF